VARKVDALRPQPAPQLQHPSTPPPPHVS
jgi:hypothetical protein